MDALKLNYLELHAACYNYGGMADQRQKSFHRLVQSKRVMFAWD